MAYTNTVGGPSHQPYSGHPSGGGSSGGTHGNANAAACPQCRTTQTRFYCADPCLTKRLAQHSDDVGRITSMRDQVKARVEALMAPMPGFADLDQPYDARPAAAQRASSAPLEDPFGEPESEDTSFASTNSTSKALPAPHPGASQTARCQRARRDELIQLIDTAQQASSASRLQVATLSETVMERRAQLDKRKEMLRRAREIVCGQETAVGVWPSPPPLVEAEEQASETTHGHATMRTVTLIKKEIRQLEEKGKGVANELAGLRARLAREACTIFRVSPPPGSFAAAAAGGAFSLSSAAALARNQRSKERYSAPGVAAPPAVPGAFDLRSNRAGAPAATGQIAAAAAAALASAASANSDDWTICGLVLPVPRDAKRFSRDAINGAVAHTVHLMQLVSAYIGVQLPFAIESNEGALSIKRNVMWAGGGSAGSETSLQLSTSAYGALTAPPPGTSGGGLGASTLSTLESFVQLPGGQHFSWGLASVLSPNAGAASPRNPGEGSSGAAEDPAKADARGFGTALVMLAYNAAYVANTQGLKVDVKAAAGSSLRLLSRAAGSTQFGQRSHSTLHASAHLIDISFPDLDFTQLLKAHELTRERGVSSSSNGNGSSSSKKQPGSTRGSTSSSKRSSIMEASYVDAGDAAASLLDVSRGANAARTASTPKSSSANAALAKAPPPSTSSRAPLPARVPAALPSAPKHLDFLKQRSKSSPASKEATGTSARNKAQAQALGVGTATRKDSESSKLKKPSSSSTAQPTAPHTSAAPVRAKETPVVKEPAKVTSSTKGAVIFNGVEVGGDTSTDDEDWSRKSVRAKGKATSTQQQHGGEDEWDVVSFLDRTS